MYVESEVNKWAGSFSTWISWNSAFVTLNGNPSSGFVWKEGCTNYILISNL